jgi:hypothetical protein
MQQITLIRLWFIQMDSATILQCQRSNKDKMLAILQELSQDHHNVNLRHWEEREIRVVLVVRIFQHQMNICSLKERLLRTGNKMQGLAVILTFMGTTKYVYRKLFL